jgi:hypothetical protein
VVGHSPPFAMREVAPPPMGFYCLLIRRAEAPASAPITIPLVTQLRLGR